MELILSQIVTFSWLYYHCWIVFSGIQVRQVMKDAATQCRLSSSATVCPPSASLCKKRRLVVEEDSESPLLPSTQGTDSTYNIDDDFSLPNTGTTAASDDVNHTNKYIVFQSSLWQLFEVCPVCQTRCSIHYLGCSKIVSIHVVSTVVSGIVSPLFRTLLWVTL